MLTSRISLFPHTASVNRHGHLVIGGCDTVELAAAFGTPLYIIDEQTVREKCAEFFKEFGQRYPDVNVIYACKAFAHPALADILKDENLGLDIVSLGEMHIAKSVGFPMERVYFHGNNKGKEELNAALDWGVGRVVVDNIYELNQLSSVAGDKRVKQDILIRISPGVDPHTHKHITTGVVGSKFGLPIVTGQAEEAIVKAMSDPNINLLGIHFHIGSSITKVDAYKEAICIGLDFAKQMKESYGFETKEISPGGGFAISYTTDNPAPPISEYAQAITSAMLEETQKRSLALPRLVLEPGRSIVGRSGIALYTVGGQKEIRGIRHYAFVDGGMADNIRPALYGSEYEPMVANKSNHKDKVTVTIAGKFCESGDLLVESAHLPMLETGDLIAMPGCGAYSIPMGNNYNASLKPAIVLVKQGNAKLIRRRETYEDLLSFDNVADNRAA